MKKLITLIALLGLVIGLNAQIVYPFAGATTTTYEVADGSYDTTVIMPWNNLSFYYFNIDTATAINIDVSNDIRAGAEAIFRVYSDTTGSSTESKRVTFIGDVYGSVTDTVVQLKNYIWHMKYDGTKFYPVKSGQID